MEESAERAVRRAITTMRANLSEQLTVDDMARAAMFSKFHFTRIFQRVTGVSPGRFLSALRLQRAKYLLVSTSLNVADISLRVGYNSIGTFSSRFSRSVGMSPTTYRRRAGFAQQIQTDPTCVLVQSSARVEGVVHAPADQTCGLVFIGLFPERIPEGTPVRCAILTEPGPFRFDSVPPGTWHLLAQSASRECATGAFDSVHQPPSQPICVATEGPIAVRKDSAIRADVTLKPLKALDPPVLLALLDVRQLAVARAASAMPSLVGTAARAANEHHASSTAA
ncbi:AraC family transcriptional regulator [Dactylosporangium sp. NPDC049140]|jgi:AraC-like DNA-binding protein|uniref:AraC family transcriptional regulator n=1 Tax=Dactylosporangium sp. NPDC049140 TaxID=3155647 RepID=UPI0033E69D17